MGFGDQSRPVEGVAPRQARPQRGWRQRVRYLGLLRRCRSHREASARLGVDESTVRRWRTRYPKFGARCDEIVAERFRQNADDLRLRAGEPRTRPYFFKGKQIGEQVIHDDRALMFLLKLEDAQRARAEARAERREQREHELRMKQLELSNMPAPAAHRAVRVEAQSSSESNDLKAVPADIPPPEVVEVVSPPHLASPPRGGEEHEGLPFQTPLPREGERAGEGEEKKE